MEAEKAVQIEALEKAYGNVVALRGVNLSVERGELFGFLGPNGAGKTTTIRCMLDLIRPQAGMIRIFGHDPRVSPLTVRRSVGYLPGELSLEPNLRVGQMLRYLSRLRGNEVDWNYVRQLASSLELSLDTQIKNLSKGNKQKVGVVQALMHRPKLLLMDEPTSGLDPLMQQVVYRLLQEAREAGATLFFSSHIISEVELLADRVAIIREGVIVEEAEPDKLKNMSMRKVHVRFRERVNPQVLEETRGVNLLTAQDGCDVTLQVEGEMDELLKVLANFPVSDLETERSSLEEIFLTYYAGSRGEV